MVKMKEEKKVKLEIIGSRATFDLNELLSEMSGEALLDLAQSLACEDAVIQAVVDQIIDGMTENGSHGGTSSVSVMPRTALDRARRRIAEDAHVVARDEIKRMERHMQWRENYHKEICDWAWNMYHAWPEESIRRRPEYPR